MSRKKKNKVIISQDDLISNLIVRLYKICTHSLAEVETIEKYRHPYRIDENGVKHVMGVHVSQEGNKFSGKFSDKDLDQEKFESLAARTRPLTLEEGSESLRKTINSLRQRVTDMHQIYSAQKQYTLENEIDVLQALWSFYSRQNRSFDSVSKTLQKLGRKDLASSISYSRLYLVRNTSMTTNGTKYGGKEINLLDIGSLWVYADLVHNGIAEKVETLPHTEENRYECAIPYVFSLVWLCTKYLGQIKSMEKGINMIYNLSDEAKEALGKISINS